MRRHAWWNRKRATDRWPYRAVVVGAVIAVAGAVVGWIIVTSGDRFPRAALVVGGGGATILQAVMQPAGAIEHVVVYGSLPIVPANTPELAVAHLRIEFAPDVPVVHNSSTAGNYPNRYIWTGSYAYTIDGTTPVAITITIDGRKKTLAAAGQSFRLEDGNFFQFVVSRDAQVTVKQFPVVQLTGRRDVEATIETFESLLQAGNE